MGFLKHSLIACMAVLSFFSMSSSPALSQCAQEDSEEGSVATAQQCATVSAAGLAFSGLIPLFVPEYNAVLWRHTEHDGYRFKDGSHSYAFTAIEFSGQAAISQDWQFDAGAGDVVTLTGFFGYDGIRASFHQTRPTELSDPGRARHESLFTGLVAQYAAGQSYFSASVLGALGELRMIDTFDLDDASFDTVGVNATAYAGRVIDLGSLPHPENDPPVPVSVDLRAGIAYAMIDGEPFDSTQNGVFVQELEVDVDTTILSLEAMLWASYKGSDDDFYSPFVRGRLRNHINYDGELTVDETDRFHFAQAATTALAEIGLNYTRPSSKYFASTYIEHASDRETFGVRLGAQFDLTD